MATINKEFCGVYYSRLRHGSHTPFIEQVASVLSQSKDKWLRLFGAWRDGKYSGRELNGIAAEQIEKVMASFDNDCFWDTMKYCNRMMKKR